MDLRRDLTVLALGTLLGVAAVLGIQYYEQSTKSEVGIEAKETVGEQRKLIPCTPSTVFDDGLKKDLGLPKDVVKDKDKKVASAVQVHAAMHAHTVTAVKDLENGDTEMFVRHDPLPWFGFEHPTYAAISYGYDDLGAITRVSAGMSLMQIKLVDFSVYILGDDRGGKEAGIEARAGF